MVEQGNAVERMEVDSNDQSNQQQQQQEQSPPILRAFQPPAHQRAQRSLASGGLGGSGPRHGAAGNPIPGSVETNTGGQSQHIATAAPHVYDRPDGSTYSLLGFDPNNPAPKPKPYVPKLSTKAVAQAKKTAAGAAGQPDTVLMPPPSMTRRPSHSRGIGDRDQMAFPGGTSSGPPYGTFGQQIIAPSAAPQLQNQGHHTQQQMPNFQNLALRGGPSNSAMPMPLQSQYEPSLYSVGPPNFYRPTPLGDAPVDDELEGGDVAVKQVRPFPSDPTSSRTKEIDLTVTVPTTFTLRPRIRLLTDGEIRYDPGDTAAYSAIMDAPLSSQPKRPLYVISIHEESANSWDDESQLGGSDDTIGTRIVGMRWDQLHAEDAAKIYLQDRLAEKQVKVPIGKLHKVIGSDGFSKGRGWEVMWEDLERRLKDRTVVWVEEHFIEDDRQRSQNGDISGGSNEQSVGAGQDAV